MNNSKTKYCGNVIAYVSLELKKDEFYITLGDSKYSVDYICYYEHRI